MSTSHESWSAGSLRIGDAERIAAATALGDQFAAGRIDQDELEERLGAAYAARTYDDLDPLFADLPEPRPARPVAAAVAPTPWGPPPRPAGGRGPAWWGAWAVPDTQANFFWLRLGADTPAFAAACERAGVMVRPYGTEGVRVTIGEQAANDVFLQVAADWRAAAG